MEISSRSIDYRDGDRELSGVLFWNDADRRERPGVLVIHAGAGLDDHASLDYSRFVW